MALYNPGTAASTLTFTLFDVNGGQVRTAMSTLAGGAHLSRSVAGDLFGEISNFRGTLVVAGTKPVAASVVRQNPTAQSYVLLPAVPSTSMRLKFFVPQLADGPTAMATLQTTFLLANLSKSTATVTLTLSQDSGAPWVVNIPGLDATNTVKLPPGGSAFLQTDGQGSYSTGAAALVSDKPISVAAVVTASGAGTLLSETGLTESPAQSQLLLPIDTTNNINTGAAFYNPTVDPVTLTLNLLDPDGNQLGSTQIGPLAPGAHMSGYVSDFFPGTSGVRGTLSVTASGVLGAAVSVAGLRQNATALALVTSPVAHAASTGAGLNLTTAQDSTHQTMFTVPPAGGTLSVTDSQGNKFTLTIPAGALLNTEMITMTAVSSVTGLPPGGAFAAGFQLAPDGLILFKPALLTIEPSGAIPPGMAIALGWHGTGQGVYLNLVQPHTDKLTLALTHFSGAAVVTGSDAYVTTQLLNIANILDLDSSTAGYWTQRARAEEIQGLDGSADYQRALNIMEQGFSDIELLMRLALETQDDDVLRCAMLTAIGYERQREIIANGSSTDATGSAINTFVQTASNIVKQHAQDRCNNAHDPLAGLELLGQARQATILGAAAADPAAADVSKCSPNPVLDFKSQQLLVTQDPNSMGSFDGTVTGKVPLQGRLSQASLQPGGDGFTSFLLSGSGPLNYTSFSYTATTSIGGSAAPASSTGSTLTIIQSQGNSVSEIKYKFTPKFTPMAVQFNGQTLSQFCPVYDKTPASVTLIIDPGSPQETVRVTTPGGSLLTNTTLWKGGWNYFHNAGADGGIITGWQIPGGSSFAHKDVSQDKMYGVAGGTFHFTEKTTLDLNNSQ